MSSAEQLERQVLQFCRHVLQFTAQEKILIACSGGTDSMALAELLQRISSHEPGWQLAICHVHHGLRGTAADHDADQVAQYAAERQIPFFLRRVAAGQYAQSEGLSIEDAARRLRYQALEEVRHLSGCTLIATGHHKEDQAETVLMRLLRGAGPAGLAGILPRRAAIVRPLLFLRRHELTAYCQERQLTVCEDESNADTAFLRNRIRHVLLPQLAADYNPELVETLAKTALLCRREDAFLESLLEPFLSQVVWNQDEARIPLAAAQSLPEVLQARFWRKLLRGRNGADAEVSFSNLEDIVALVRRGKTGKKMPLPGGWLLECEYEALLLHRPDETAHAAFSHALPLPGQCLLPDGARIVAGVCETRPVIAGAKDEACFSLAALTLPLTVRTRLPGDVFRPAGGTGGKKLKAFFIDVKVPQRLRDGWPLVCDEAGILWLPGLRATQRDEAGGPWLLLKRINREDKEYAPGY